MAVGKKGSGTKRRREVDVVEEVVLSGEESSEGGGAGREEDVEGFQGGVSVDEEDEGDDARETAAEKRLRLAKKYLSDLGVEDDESGGDEEEELEATAKRNAGLLSANLADGLVDAKVSVSTSRKGHRLSPTCISMTPDNLLAVSGGKDRRVVIWDVEKCKVIHSFRGGDPHKKAYTQVGHVKEVLSVAVSDDGRLAASGGLDKLIRVWDTRSKQAVQALSGHRSGVNSLVFRRGSKQLFTASSDRTLNLYDLGEMAYVESLFGHGAEVISVDALSKERALSGGMDGTVRLWKLTEGSQLVFKSPAQSIDAVAMLNDSSFLTGGSNGALYLWGVHKKKPLYTITSPHGGERYPITSVTACPFSDLCASGSHNGQVSLWKAHRLRTDQKDFLEQVHSVSVDGFVNGICFGKTGRVLAIASGQEHRLGRWSRTSSWKANCISFMAFSEPN